MEQKKAPPKPKVMSKRVWMAVNYPGPGPDGSDRESNDEGSDNGDENEH
jgi:hypothetical protein